MIIPEQNASFQGLKGFVGSVTFWLKFNIVPEKFQCIPFISDTCIR